MLELGFKEDVEKIMKAIKDSEEGDQREPPQFVLFSATMPVWVREVAKTHLGTHVFFDLVKDLKNKTSSTVQHLAINCPFFNRTATLGDILLCYKGLNGKAIIFA
jgi:ATP-dependent RNA helicase DDX21